MLEVDNLALVNLLRSEAGERSPIAGLWHEIRELGREFVQFHISFVNREGNEAAHFCAKLSSESNRANFWAEAFPLGFMGSLKQIVTVAAPSKLNRLKCTNRHLNT